MALAMVGTLVLTISFVINYWRRVELLKTQWGLLALRDRVRNRAIHDRAFAGSEAFRYFDRTLFDFWQVAPSISLWVVLPTLVLAKPADRASLAGSGDRLTAIAKDDPWCHQLHMDSGALLLKTLALRHVALISLVALTGVGAIALVVMAQRSRGAVLQLSRALISPLRGYIPNGTRLGWQRTTA